MPPRTSFETIDCSIARTMALLGEPWTALILRDLFIGITRFDALHSHLGASRKILALVEVHGVSQESRRVPA
ncbi:MAG: winged helix-turn-helix transcriptional regulator [Solirubrobacteraceae bacterium]